MKPLRAIVTNTQTREDQAPLKQSQYIQVDQHPHIHSKMIRNGESNKPNGQSGQMQKHPLQHGWSLWYFRHERDMDWKDCQHFVASVNTVEDFWSMYSYVELPSRLNNGCDYSFFKEGIEPKWEDDLNKKGGRWILNLDKRLPDLDRVWSDLLMATIGDEFGEKTEDLCGLVLSVRQRMNKICVWTRNKNDMKSNVIIGNIFKRIVDVHNSSSAFYQSHEDAANK